ncbi:Rrf2 family transcriptional regulator [Paenibacillus sp. F411]|uniref:Transcriptional regulator, BadM/Rrf2 family n=1 Tax=Paenibacillus algicola TaxID=2565926 RepID=A0A4P8XMF4_9BACL|nr:MULTISPECIES: Rrf2 family transcriptional regulator [Paenibacillus]MBO2943673.1 Rrf2 family transcriptional regulator [Paenibacillus sp. F411]QCT03718.1 transcriptional regulator, BadM/Rrf2 family [Paenibacillus algicola]
MMSKKPIGCPSTYKSFSLALQALTTLAVHAGTCSSSDLAASLKADPTLLRRILKALSLEGMIESREGRDGGYRFVRSADHITLAEVYSCLHIHRAVTDSMLDAAKEHCGGAALKAVFSEVLDEIEQSTMKVLSSYTVGDMVRKAETG